MDTITSSRRSWDEIEFPWRSKVGTRSATGQGAGPIPAPQSASDFSRRRRTEEGISHRLPDTWRQCGEQYRPHRAAEARRYAHPRGCCPGFRRQSGREFDDEPPPPNARPFSIRCRDRRIKEIFELIDASWRGDIFVARHPLLTVLSCMPIAIGDLAPGSTVRSDGTPVTKEGVLGDGRSLRQTLRIVVARWCSDLTSQFAAWSRSVRVFLLSPAAGRLADPGIIPVVDEGRVVGFFRVELDDPAALGLCPQQDIGHHGLRQRRIKRRAPGRGFERFESSAIISATSYGIDRGTPEPARAMVAGGEQAAG